MKREDTLFKASYDFMRKRGYKITKNSKFNKFDLSDFDGVFNIRTDLFE